LATLNIVLTDTEIRDEKDNAIAIFPQLNKFLKEKTKNISQIKEISAFVRKN